MHAACKYVFLISSKMSYLIDDFINIAAPACARSSG